MTEIRETARQEGTYTRRSTGKSTGSKVEEHQGNISVWPNASRETTESAILGGGPGSAGEEIYTSGRVEEEGVVQSLLPMR